MRFIPLTAVVASIVATAVSRHLPPEAIAQIARLQNSSGILPDTGADSPPLPGASTPPGSWPDSDEDTDDDSPYFPLNYPASDELWDKHVRKGSSLNCGMRGTDQGAGYQLEDTRNPPSAASRWVGGILETIDWYWWDAGSSTEICDMGGYWGLGSTFRILGISPRSAPGGTLQCFQLKHSNEHAKYPDGSPKGPLAQSYVVDGTLYHVS